MRLVALGALAACGSSHAPSDAQAADAAADSQPVDARIDAPVQVFGELHATFALTDVAGAAQPCPAGYPTAVLVASQPMQPPIRDLFDCAAGTGTATYEVGTYVFELEIATTNETEVYGASLPQAISITDDQHAAFTLLTDGGYFELAWTLVGAVSGAPLACSEIPGLTTIAVAVSGASSATVPFPCAAGSGISPGLVAGSYTATVTAQAAQMTVLGQAAPIANTVAVQDAIADWGTVTISVPGQ